MVTGSIKGGLMGVGAQQIASQLTENVNSRSPGLIGYFLQTEANRLWRATAR